MKDAHSEQLKNHTAFIFDLDGVIVDSTEVHTQVWVRYLAALGVDSGGIKERMHGLRNDEIVRDLFGDTLSEEQVAKHGADKEAMYRTVMLPQLEAHLVPGIRAFLERHRDVPMAIGSNAEPLNVSSIIDAAGLRGYFRAVVDGHQVQHPKPHPEVYLKAAQLLGFSATDCVVFEDSSAGVAAARAAGARVVGLGTTCRSLEGVDIMVPDFQAPELESWLTGASPRS